MGKVPFFYHVALMLLESIVLFPDFCTPIIRMLGMPYERNFSFSIRTFMTNKYTSGGPCTL